MILIGFIESIAELVIFRIRTFFFVLKKSLVFQFKVI